MLGVTQISAQQRTILKDWSSSGVDGRTYGYLNCVDFITDILVQYVLNR
jgi:hypothetical protein